ncbi:MAG: hypothetical protein AAF368_01250, partial [Planctomycetota bacterium]
RGPKDLPAPASFEGIAKSYLQGESFEVLQAKDAVVAVSKSRFIFGSVADNPAAAEAFRAMGGKIDGEKLLFASMSLAADAGLAIVAPDPDGQGELILMTGGNSNGAFACLTAPVDVGKEGWTAIYERKVRGKGSLPATIGEQKSERLQIDVAVPQIVRLDHDARHLLALNAQYGGEATDEAALRIARSFRGYLDTLHAAGFENGLHYGRWLLAQGPALLEKHGEFAEGAPVLLAKARAKVNEALGEEADLRPAYFLLWGLPKGTNARTFDVDRVTGRIRVLLNLSALADAKAFTAAAVHETVHTRQKLSDRSLKGRALAEGIASYLTHRILPDLTQAEALMWTPEELESAQKNETKLLEAFKRASLSDDPEVHATFLQLGPTPAGVPGAPSRTAYWIGYLAAKRWHAANKDEPLSALLQLTALDLFPEK